MTSKNRNREIFFLVLQILEEKWGSTSKYDLKPDQYKAILVIRNALGLSKQEDFQ